MTMISNRTSAEGNTQRSNEALGFAEVFFHRQDKDRGEALYGMYHDQSTLIWNGSPYKTKTNITKFYQSQLATETTVQALDAQIMPPMGDIIDMITVIAAGKIKQNDREYNFSRTFLLGPNSPTSTEYLIVSDTMRMHS
uniref:NTF2-related export protein n=1 Tax=Aceria tosichella TaxID=561515 RepID=A0A6G1SDQ8_9ACAR